MVNLAEFVDLYALGTSSSYGDYKWRSFKFVFGGFLLIAAIVILLGFISRLFKKSSQKAVEPPMPSNHTIKRPVK
jgi:hypothetical protein